MVSKLRKILFLQETDTGLLKNISQMKEREELNIVQKDIDQQQAAMLYFYSDRCAPCISLRPKVIAMIKEEFPKIELLFVNAEKHPEIPAHYGVFANPTIILFIDGREYFRYSKYISENQLSSQIGRLYSLAFD